MPPVGEGPINETTDAALGIHQDQWFIDQPVEYDLGLFAKRQGCVMTFVRYRKDQ